jgi:hypothetical protein
MEYDLGLKCFNLKKIFQKTLLVTVTSPLIPRFLLFATSESEVAKRTQRGGIEDTLRFLRGETTFHHIDLGSSSHRR